MSPPFPIFPLFFHIFIFANYCALCIMYCLLCLMYYAICNICYVLCTVHYALYGMHYVLCIIYFPLFLPFVGVLLARWICYVSGGKIYYFYSFPYDFISFGTPLACWICYISGGQCSEKGIKINIKAGQFLLPCFLFLLYSFKH